MVLKFPLRQMTQSVAASRSKLRALVLTSPVQTNRYKHHTCKSSLSLYGMLFKTVFDIAFSWNSSESVTPRKGVLKESVFYWTLVKVAVPGTARSLQFQK